MAENNKQYRRDCITFTSVGNFKLKAAYGLPCAYCGETILTLQKQKEIGHCIGHSHGKKLRRLLETMFTNKKPLAEKEVALTITNAARTYPGKNVQEIFIAIMPEAESRLIADQKLVIERARELAGDLKGETLQRIQKDFAFIDGILTNTFGDTIFKRKTLIAGFRELMDTETNTKNKSILKKIFDTLPKLPTSGNSIDAFIVKYHRRQPTEIGMRMLEPYLASGEHILPESCEGPSHFSNYLVIHKRCNEKRGCIDFRAYLKKNKQMIDLIHRHLAAVDSKIKKGYKFEGSDTYIEEVTKRLNEESGGLINWEKYCRIKKKKRKVNEN